MVLAFVPLLMTDVLKAPEGNFCTYTPNMPLVSASIVNSNPNNVILWRWWKAQTWSCEDGSAVDIAFPGFRRGHGKYRPFEIFTGRPRQ